jgi:hypothetical protein
MYRLRGKWLIEVAEMHAMSRHSTRCQSRMIRICANAFIGFARPRSLLANHVTLEASHSGMERLQQSGRRMTTGREGVIQSVAARDAIQSSDGSGVENRCREQPPNEDLTLLPGSP